MRRSRSMDCCHTEEAGMSKDISCLELLAPSLCNARRRGTKLQRNQANPDIHYHWGYFTKPKQPTTMIKEHDQKAKMKATPRKIAYVDSDKEAPAGSLARESEDSLQEQRTDTLKNVKEARRPKHNQGKGKKGKDTYEDLNSPYKRPKPTPFTQRITHFKYHMRVILPQNIRVYEGNKDPEDHLGIFSAAAKQEEWLMPVWCKMFRQTLGGATRNRFDDLDPKSVNCFEELNQKFLEEFSQQKRYAKDPTEIHGIKRRQNKGLQAFKDRSISKSSHIKGVPPVLCISAFIHGHGHPELAKKLNDKIPKTVDEMFERVRAFIRGEVTVRSAEMVHPSQGDKWYIHPAWTEGPEKARIRGGQREARRNMGVYTPYPRKDTFAPLIKTLKEILAMESGQGSQHQRLLSIKKANRRSCGLEEVGSSGEGHPPEQPAEWESGKERCNQVRRILVDGGSSSEIMYEHCFRDLNVNIRSKLIRCRAPIVGFSVETYHPLGLIDLRVTMGRAGRSKTVLMEFAIIKCHFPYNDIIGRTGKRSLEAVGSTIHFMIKFPTNQGIVTMETIREALWECRQLERVQGPVSLEKTWDREDTEEVFTISHERPDQYITMGATLTVDCKQLLTKVLRENMKSSSTPIARPTGGFRADYEFVSTLDDEIRRDPEREVGYGITDTWDEMIEGVPEAPVTDETELGQRLTDFVTTVRQETNEIYGRLDDAQDDRSLMSGQLNMMYRDRHAHARTAKLMETEARLSRKAWVQSMDASDTAHFEVRALRTTVLAHHAKILGLRATDHTRQAQLVETLTLTRTL
ncbi:hypothetical protein Tco_0009354 [Tanacetum coccineum]